MRRPIPVFARFAAGLAGLGCLVAIIGFDASSPAPAASGTNALGSIGTNAVAGTNALAGSKGTNALAGTNVVLMETNSIFEDNPANGRNPFFRVARTPAPVAPPCSGVEPAQGQTPPAPPKPKPEVVLTLTGIMGTSHRRAALINDRTFEVGDEAVIRSGESQARVLCLEIGAQHAVVQVDGKPESIKLMLKNPKSGGGN